MSRSISTFRYGTLSELRQIADNDEPMDEVELRALVLNLLDVVCSQQSELNRLWERLPADIQ